MSQSRNLRGALLAVLSAAALMALLVACSTLAPTPPAPTSAPTPEPTVAEAVPTDVPTVAPTEEPQGDQATLVVQLDKSRTVVRKIDFTAPISGLALLEQSGLNVVKADFDWGTAVCGIEGSGCPAENCFCNDKIFWNYLSWRGDGWAGYPVSAGQSVISTTGAVEGWQWGTGETTPMAPARAEAAYKALTYLRSQQVITDGSYSSSAAASVDTLLAIDANHEDAAQWRPAQPSMAEQDTDSASLLDFVVEHGAEFSQQGVAEAGKLAVALSGANSCWPAGAMQPSDYSETIGALQADSGPLAWAILGTLALSEPVPTGSVSYLLEQALPDGGWEWSPGWGHDTNSTALAVQALVAAGVPITNSAIISGEAYLQSAQAPEGGYSYDPNASWGNIADSNSTAYVLQALAALGVEAPQAAIDFLLGLQGEDGALGWQTAQPAPNLGSTQQAIPALLGQPYPLQRVALPACE